MIEKFHNWMIIIQIKNGLFEIMRDNRIFHNTKKKGSAYTSFFCLSSGKPAIGFYLKESFVDRL